MTEPNGAEPRLPGEHGITRTLPSRAIVWHDADGRIMMTNSGPYDDAAVEIIRNGPKPANTTMVVADIKDIGAPPNLLDYYVKDGKITPRPELVPGAGNVVTVASLAELPDLPKGARVTVNEVDEQIMGARGKPEVPGHGNVLMRVEAFPAKMTLVNIQRGNAPTENFVVTRMIHPESAKRKAPAKRKAK